MLFVRDQFYDPLGIGGFYISTITFLLVSSCFFFRFLFSHTRRFVFVNFCREKKRYFFDKLKIGKSLKPCCHHSKSKWRSRSFEFWSRCNKIMKFYRGKSWRTQKSPTFLLYFSEFIVLSWQIYHQLSSRFTLFNKTYLRTKMH